MRRALSLAPVDARVDTVKSFLIALGSIALFLLTSFSAMAQQGGGGGRPGHAGPARPMPPQKVPARDMGGHNPQRDARMTPEQRRQLRRDVNDHGRDIYRDRSKSNRP